MINFINTLHKNGNLTWFKFGKSDIYWAASRAPAIFRRFPGCLILTTSTVLIISNTLIVCADCDVTIDLKLEQRTNKQVQHLCGGLTCEVKSDTESKLVIFPQR